MNPTGLSPLIATQAPALWLMAMALVALPGRPDAARRFAVLAPMPTVAVAVRPHGSRRADPLAVSTAFDLLAACLRAGLPMAAAALAVAPFAPRPLGESLRRAADLMALGADPAVAWVDSDSFDPRRAVRSETVADATQTLARMARRSARSGASLAAGIAELAQQRRDDAADAAAARAERAGVLIAGPLGLCFLPAFLCLGIVPVVIGLADRVLGGGLL